MPQVILKFVVEVPASDVALTSQLCTDLADQAALAVQSMAATLSIAAEVTWVVSEPLALDA